MKRRIFGRYTGNARHARLERWLDFVMGAGYFLFAVALMAATVWIFQNLQKPLSAVGIFTVITGLFCLTCGVLTLFSDARHCFAADSKGFAALNVLGIVHRRIPFESIRKIMLLEGWHPVKSTIPLTQYDSYVELSWSRMTIRRTIDGKEQRIPELVAGIFTARSDLRPSNRALPFYLQGTRYSAAIHAARLAKVGCVSNEWRSNLLVFVPRGDNRRLFIRLLRRTKCPVTVSEKMYRLHKERIDLLFMQANADLSRLRIIPNVKENT